MTAIGTVLYWLTSDDEEAERILAAAVIGEFVQRFSLSPMALAMVRGLECAEEQALFFGAKTL